MNSDFRKRVRQSTLGGGSIPAPTSASIHLSLPSPSSSPKRKAVYNDRFIPNREGIDLQTTYQLMGDGPSTPQNKRRATSADTDVQKEEANRTFATVLRSEMFGTTQVPGEDPFNPTKRTPTTPTKNLFSYKSPHPKTPISTRLLDSPIRDTYSLSPIKFETQKLLLTRKKPPRTISKVPYKVLDAPELHDDFYLNLVDWSSTSIMGVGLGAAVYMWSSHTSKVTKLCDLGTDDSVTSVSWIQRGTHVAVGTKRGLVQIWDAEACKKVRTMSGHTARVGSLAWNDHVLTSGSRDRLIYHRDVRAAEHYTVQLSGHKQEVCGLKWNTDDNQLASGGNDNKLIIWDKYYDTPLYRFNEHTAAVKAIAWSPHQHGLLASGGGTLDKKIWFWNTLTGTALQAVDTGSQVCNLAWSKNSNEVVSTHGYSQNQIIIWKYPSLSQVATLTGHTSRVLYLAMSPDGQSIVTGAGDETLRFWNVFAKSPIEPKRDSILNPFEKIR